MATNRCTHYVSAKATGISIQLVHVNQVKPISSQAADPPLNLRLIDMSELF